MRNAIREYLEYSPAEKEELWKKAVFVFDTNVFLNLYRYSKKTRDALLFAMTELKERIWMPYQVAQEFMRRRPEIIYESCVRYDLLEECALAPFKEKLRINKDDPDFQKLQKYINQWIHKYKEKNLTVTGAANDPILEELFRLFEGRVGIPYSEEELAKIKKEGESRYKQKIPPGYKDSTKAKDGNDNNAYGDLIVWKQIIDYATKEKKDIIFVTGDRKEDWWNIQHGKTVGPRIELRKEYMQHVQTQFHMYTMEEFISYSSPAKEQAVDGSIIEEVKAYTTVHLEGLRAIQQRAKYLPHAYIDGVDVISALNSEIDALEHKNERRRSDIEGIYTNFAERRMPAKVKAMLANLKKNIDTDEMQLRALREQRNYLVHSME